MYNVVRRLTSLIVFFLCSALFVVPICDAQTEVRVEIPVFLNGESVYTETGDASLLSIAADAARSMASAEAAVLPAACARGSLTAGSAGMERIKGVLRDDMLVTASVSPSELAELINDCALYGQEMFPHVSGVTVWAERTLDADGSYRGRVYRIDRGTETLAALPVQEHAAYSGQYSTTDIMLKLVTTRELAESLPWLSVRSSDTDLGLTDAFIQHLTKTSPSAITQDAETPRLIILSDVIDTSLVLEKILADVPSPVAANLTRPDTVPDAVMYELGGQDRNLICRICRFDLPYALCINGASITAPQNVSTSVSISQTVPQGRKTANIFDDETIFVDLRDNDTLPPSTTLSAYVSKVYDPGTVLYVYRYEENGDIGTLVMSGAVDRFGCITFPIEPSSTYVINSRALDSAAFALPTAKHPYIAGVVLICAAYAVWFVVFIARRHARTAPQSKTGQD